MNLNIKWERVVIVALITIVVFCVILGGMRLCNCLRSMAESHNTQQEELLKELENN